MIDGPYNSNSWRNRLYKIEGVLSLLASIGGLIVLALNMYEWIAEGSYGKFALTGAGIAAVCLLPLLNNGRLREQLNRIGKWGAITSAALLAGGFWALIPTALARSFTGISETNALLFIFFPIAIAIAWILWPKLPKILGFEND